MVDDLKKVAREYGRSLMDTLEGQVPKPLRRLDALGLTKFVGALSAAQLEGIVRSLVSVHAQHAEALFDLANVGAPDELVVLDSSLGPIHEPTLAKLMLYAEVLVCPDPLLEHPVALRYLVPDHFHGRWPYTLPQLQEMFLGALEFYQRFGFPIREGIVLPTAWHVAVTLQKTVQNNFLGEADLSDPWDELPPAVANVAATSLEVKPGKFDGQNLTVHSFDHVPKSETSQIAILASGDPNFARCEMETYFQIIGHEDRGDTLLARMAQAPPGNDELFDKWAEKSKRKVAYNRMTSLRSDLVLATNIGGAVVTLSNTNHDILKAVAGDATPEAHEGQAAAAIATMALPMLDGISVNQIVTARKDAEALQNFRTSFRKACAAVKAEVGTSGFKAEVDNIARDTVEQGIKELRQAYRALRKKSALDLAFSTALVAVSFTGVSLGQLQWLPAFLGSLAQVKSIFDAVPKQDEMRKNPYFMLWSMSRKPFHSGPG